ncbi:MAG TPA: 6-phosphogluconolactonase, partial [Pyrinomonadaceae bacterium]|nr:6-phosphogluconolactonase [Pyrinomonadaceae bacterium]
AEKFIEIADNAIEKRGFFTVVLAGGSTPKSFFQLLSSEKFGDKIDWSRTFFFFGDERNVLPDADESNFKMANENLFKPLKINDENIFRWHTELKDAEKITADYEEKIRLFFESKTEMQFDLILLGMGGDGHTASLFPYTTALNETEKIAVANYVEKLQTTRLTLTFPTIKNARNIIFLVAGEEKAETLRDVLEGEFDPDRLPSQNIRPTNGNLFWLIDENVAKLLSKDGN